MSGPLDVIKSYLVSLGFQVDDPSYRKLQQTLDGLTSKITANASGMASTYIKAASAVVGALATVNSAVVGLMNHTAQADLGWRKYALHMYMAEGQARRLKITTDALGESLDDIAWMPELRGRYMQLMREGRQMDVSEQQTDAASRFREIRDVRFEFTRLKVEGTFALQWIGYHLSRYLSGPLKSALTWLRGINDWIREKMPDWTDRVARGLAKFVDLGAALYKAGRDVFKVFEDIWNALGKTGQSITVVGAAILAFFMAGPFGQAAMIISGLILLIEDFYAYMEGKDSSKTLAPIWAEFLGVGRELRLLFKDIARLVNDLFSIDINLDGSTLGKSLKWLVQIIGGIVQRSIQGIRSVAVLGSIIALKAQGKDDEAQKRAGEFLTDVDYYGPRDHAVYGGGSGSAAKKGAGILPAIARQESGGDYGKINPHSGAAGKYQIMPENWGPWSTEAGLPVGAAMTPENQEKVAAYKMAQYKAEFGDERLVAAAWYAGPGYARAAKAGRFLFDPDRKQGKYPSVNEYVAGVTGRNLSDIAAGGRGGVNVSSTVTVGDIHVTQPNASADEIASAVGQRVKEEQDRQIERMIRDAGGPIH